MKKIPLPVFSHAGKFISRGRGMHAARIIDSLELIYVQQGELHIADEKNVFSVQTGERLFLFPDRKHWGTAPYAPNLRFFWMHLYFPRKREYGFFQKYPQCAPVFSREFFDVYTGTILSEEYRFSDRNDPVSRQNLNDLAAILLRESLRSLPPGIKHIPVHSMVQFTDDFIRLHFEEDLTTSLIAGKLNCHPDYLSRLYSQTRGYTIGDAIRRERIAKACSLLSYSTESIKQVAYDSGFNDISYFRRQFIRERGMRPHEYRHYHWSRHINTE